LSKNPKDLIGYCGLYCGACGIYQGKMKQAVENLRKIIGYYGFDKITVELAKWEPAFQYYAEFENVLNGLVKLFGGCPRMRRRRWRSKLCDSRLLRTKGLHHLRGMR
jgi:hypothetical protein